MVLSGGVLVRKYLGADVTPALGEVVQDAAMVRRESEGWT